MKFIDAICTQCGGIEFNIDGNKFTCKHCGLIKLLVDEITPSPSLEFKKSISPSAEFKKSVSLSSGIASPSESLSISPSTTASPSYPYTTPSPPYIRSISRKIRKISRIFK